MEFWQVFAQNIENDIPEHSYKHKYFRLDEKYNSTIKGLAIIKDISNVLIRYCPKSQLVINFIAVRLHFFWDTVIWYSDFSEPLTFIRVLIMVHDPNSSDSFKVNFLIDLEDAALAASILCFFNDKKLI